MSADTPAMVARPLHRRRWVLWGLAASLALNGFLIGALATDFLTGATERRGMFHFETRMLGRNLPESQADALRESVREIRPELRRNWRRLRELRREINTLAAEPEPDRAAIDARLGEIREITSGMQAAVQARVFDEVLALPPETRARLDD